MTGGLSLKNRKMGVETWVVSPNEIPLQLVTFKEAKQKLPLAGGNKGYCSLLSSPSQDGRDWVT